MSTFKDALRRAVTRSKAPEPGLEEIVKTLGGTQAAADQLGVSQRQVQRYLKADREGREVKSTNFDRLRELGRKAPEVRAKQISSRRAARMRNRGAKVKFKGKAGVRSGGKNYFRKRRIECAISGEAMANVVDLWMAGDDDAALDAFREAMANEYTSDFDFESIDHLEFQRLVEESYE